MLKGLLGVILAGLFTSAYGFFIEPALRLRVRRWQISPPGWQGRALRIAVIADLHMGEPYVGLKRLKTIVARTNALAPDITVFLGDMSAGHRFITRKIPVADIAAELARLTAPLGVWAILGNHDWWDDRAAQKRRAGPAEGGLALQASGITVLENQAIRLGEGAGTFWLAGLGDQLAFIDGGGKFIGVEDLPGTLAQIAEDGAPVLMLAHEPDIFPQIPARVGLTLSGHTHGGQVRLFGYSPMVPSRFGNRFANGHVREEGRDLVVSGGIGCSIAPVRFGVVPEITLIEIQT